MRSEEAISEVVHWNSSIIIQRLGVMVSTEFAKRMKLRIGGLDVVDNNHNGLTLGLSLWQYTDRGESADDASDGRGDCQGQQQHLHHLPSLVR